MELRNYWWLLIWLFLFGGVSLAFFPKREEIVLGKPVQRWGKLAAAALALPYVIWAGWRPDYFGDTGQYRSTFLRLPTSLADIGEYLGQASKDRGFTVLSILFKSLISHSDIVFFLVIAAIQMYCLVRIYRKYSENYWLSMFLFVASADYLSWMHNGMRQFLAVTMIFAALPLLIQRRYIPMILVVLLASQIHLSALVFLPFIFIVNGKAWNIRTVLFLFGVLAALFFLEEVTGFITSAMEDTVYEGDIRYFESDNGTNLFRVLFYSVPAILSIPFRSRIEAEDDPLINVCVNLSVVAAGFYIFSFFTSGILIGRLPIYFSLANYILIPWLIGELFTPDSAMLVEAGFVGVYSVYSYIQMHSWGLL